MVDGRCLECVDAGRSCLTRPHQTAFVASIFARKTAFELKSRTVSEILRLSCLRFYSGVQ
jgi:hypothetical protein